MRGGAMKLGCPERARFATSVKLRAFYALRSQALYHNRVGRASREAHIANRRRVANPQRTKPDPDAHHRDSSESRPGAEESETTMFWPKAKEEHLFCRINFASSALHRTMT